MGDCEVVERMKTAYYTVYAPVVLGLVMGGVATEGNLEVVRRVAVGLGRFYQVQDDFLDLFGDEAVLGKEMGRDVKQGKMTWLVVGPWDRAGSRGGFLRGGMGGGMVVGMEEVYRVMRMR
ncbi:terpenoid synthase [Aspergillus ellipticus CBS 707.79]|uniref:Terpenoid synthase n=1 Tax=Aspergillus ellipticus CBS 707.79 TaxID=1448320 RepID=A0A319DCE8_9EURO|nr:terpenoid synthase [Aspergillus ellipticus CBS 707.79]